MATTPASPSPPLDLPAPPPLPPSSTNSKLVELVARPLPPRPSPKLPPLPPPIQSGENTPNALQGGRFAGVEMLGAPGGGGAGERTPLSGPATPQQSSSRAQQIPDLSSLPLAPLPHHLAPFLSPQSPLSVPEKRQLFTSIYLRSCSSGASDTLEWLLALPSDPSLSLAANALAHRRRLSLASLSAEMGQGTPEELVLDDTTPRKWVELEARDEEGNTALGLCTALGHAEGVRLLVEAGVSVESGDRAGWTPLHWAVQNNDIPIASYLLNHRASPLSCSHKGLTPRDLVKRGDEGLVMREVLRSAWEAAVERERIEEEGEETASEGGEDDEGPTRPISRSGSVVSSLMGHGWTNDPAKVEEERKERKSKKRLELALQSALWLEVDLGVLGFGGVARASNGEVFGGHDDDQGSEDGIPAEFVWTQCLPDQMLVFSLADLSTIFDVVITTMRPVRQRHLRVIPANVVFLSARYAHYHATPDLLEELVVGAMERIEAAVHHRPDDMSNCAFWLSNSLLLLYYLRKEPNLAAATREMQVHLCDLINEIFVFVIRDAERRIDRVLEPAILKHEQMKGLSDDVRMEGEWRVGGFVKKLTGGRAGGKKASASPASKAAGAGTAGLGGLFGGGGGTTAAEALGEDGSKSPKTSEREEPSPKMVTALLSSTLFILQSYEIPPSIVVQAFSQLFYWIACEVFNRLLTQRKYLCRSRAMQIRLNISTLEDWARSNLLPSKMVSVHFAPLNQLLQWLQCLSSEGSIDGLIGTVQSLRSLNPLQLRRAVREYRYEVDESRMDEDCSQYLLQIQNQWERMRLQKTVEAVGGSPALPNGGEGGALPMSRGSSGSTSSSINSEDRAAQEQVTKMIDDVFSDPSSFGSYTPPGGSEALGELLNSRYMLPFAVPSSAEMLLNFNSRDAFGPFASQDAPYAPSSSGGTLTPSQSTTSLSSAAFQPSSRRSSLAPSVSSISTNPHRQSFDSASMTWDGVEREREEKREFVPVLPDSFWAVMDEARQQARVSAIASRINPPTPMEDEFRVHEWVSHGLGLGEVGAAGDGEGWTGEEKEDDRNGVAVEQGESTTETFDKGVLETPKATSGPFSQALDD